MAGKLPNDRGSDILHRQLIKLGDMMGDGLHHEEPWIEKEYARVFRLIRKNDPELRAMDRQMRQERNRRVDEAMAKLITKKGCLSCGGELRQSRSGSRVVYCKQCGTRMRAGKKGA